MLAVSVSGSAICGGAVADEGVREAAEEGLRGGAALERRSDPLFDLPVRRPPDDHALVVRLALPQPHTHTTRKTRTH
jgi:hypothetical protein